MFQRVYSSLEIKKAIEEYDKVKSFRKAASRCGISKSTIQRWYSKFHSFILRTPRKRVIGKNRNRVQKYPSLIQDINDMFSKCTKVSFFTLDGIRSCLTYKPSLSWIHACLKKARVSRRRFISMASVNTRNMGEMKALYTAFENIVSAFTNDEIVCLDETGFCNVGNPFYGYHKKGMIPTSQHVRRRERSSMIMAIHASNGIIAHHQQPMAFNSTSFMSFVKDVLFHQIPQGVKCVIMDNVAFHKNKQVVSFLETNGITPLFIPPYSPRCNPIEEVFSLIKRKFRVLAQDTITRGGLPQHVEEAVQVVATLHKDMTCFYNHTRRFLHEQHTACEYR